MSVVWHEVIVSDALETHRTCTNSHSSTGNVSAYQKKVRNKEQFDLPTLRHHAMSPARSSSIGESNIIPGQFKRTLKLKHPQLNLFCWGIGSGQSVANYGTIYVNIPDVFVLQWQYDWKCMCVSKRFHIPIIFSSNDTRCHVTRRRTITISTVHSMKLAVWKSKLIVTDLIGRRLPILSQTCASSLVHQAAS